MWQKTHEINEETILKVATQTNGYSGADMENIVNESAYTCISNQHRAILNEDLFEAFNKCKT